MSEAEYVGIDVSKARLDVASTTQPEPWESPNTPAGHAALVERWCAQPPTLLVVEASGGFERDLVLLCQIA